MTTADLLQALRAALGDDHVLTAPADMAGYAEDWRKRYRGVPLAVALPGTTEQVASVVRLCRAARAAIVPQGGNTGLVGGAAPDGSGRQIVLSLKRMRRVRALDAADRVLVAEAGCVLAEVQRA
ncbi:FAD linked oxidase domain protein, partial [mine drainage metagenome]